MTKYGSFPGTRPRRLRTTPVMRRMVAETRLHPADFILPAFVREGKAYLSIGVGCTGGRHRSVAISEQLAERLRAHGYRVTVHHRDVERD